MKIAAAVLFSMTLMMDVCDDNNKNGEQWVVMRNPSTHACAAMKATAMGSAAGMTEQLQTYPSQSQAVAGLAAFKSQQDPNNPVREVCE
jgi:hypothetical protein